MKKYCLLILICVAGLYASAQQKLMIKGKGNALYIEHKVGEKESLSSVGRLYGITASQLARFNGKSPSALLGKNSSIKVPLKIQDIQTVNTGAPVYHTVGKGDNLFKIAQVYNKVPLTQLKKWNKISVNAVKNGQEIIVGFLKLNMEQAVVPKTITTEVVAEKSNETVTANTDKSVSVVNDPVVKTENKPDATKSSTESQKETIAVLTPESDDEGFFASLYLKHDITLVQKSLSGTAATFKTISGWTDRKYYVLVNGITPGTIVRITTSNDKSICARVLGPLPETKGAENLVLRLSNAAASVLDMKDLQFTVTLTYFE